MRRGHPTVIWSSFCILTQSCIPLRGRFFWASSVTPPRRSLSTPPFYSHRTTSSSRFNSPPLERLEASNIALSQCGVSAEQVVVVYRRCANNPSPRWSGANSRTFIGCAIVHRLVHPVDRQIFRTVQQVHPKTLLQHPSSQWTDRSRSLRRFLRQPQSRG